MRTAVLTIIFAAYLSACGGGGSGGPPPPPTPPTGLSYNSPNVFAMGGAITPLTPTVTGSVSSYAVNPSLPAGLGLNASSGTISGTPTAVTAAASYTVTASNSAGSTTFPVVITVNNVAPTISYATTYPALTIGVPVSGLTPSNSGGAVVSWSVSPALPSGLTFSTADGSITGTPTAEATPATYVVTAANSGGSSSVSLTIAVGSVLLELGHASPIQTLRFSGSRVLSQDTSGHWVLWDYATDAIIASGDSQCVPASSPCSAGYPQVDLEGPSIVLGTPAGFEVRASTDGRILSTIVGTFAWWKLAADGNYICAGGQTGLSAWSASGKLLLSRTGDYSKATSFAAAGEIRVALGPAGQNVVETISVGTGASSTSAPFQGQFHSWFLDGERFLTYVGTTVWVYSKTSVQQDIKMLPSLDHLTGQGGWFWSQSGSGGPLEILDIYAVGASGTPTASYTSQSPALPSGMTIGLAGQGMTVIDLSGSSVSSAIYPWPFSCCYSPFAATSSTRWVVGTVQGRIIDGLSSPSAPRYFGIGAVASIAGSDARIAVATSAGSILYFDAHTKAPEGSLNLNLITDGFSGNLALSSDGSILAAWAYSGWFVSIFSLPSGSDIYTWSYSYSWYPQAVSLSGSGTALGQVLGNTTGYAARQVTSPTGGPLLWSDSGSPEPIRLSPDGTFIAVSTGDRAPATGTNIFKNGNLVTAVPGWVVGWIDNSRVLVNSYIHYGLSALGVYAGCSIYDVSGTRLTSPPLPELSDFQSVTMDSIYAASSNSILSLLTGAATWTSPHPSTGIGAVAGSHVVFASGARVLSEPY